MFSIRPCLHGLIALATTIAAAQPASAQFPLKYSIGTGVLVDPHDVAVYAPGDSAGYVFVADAGLDKLFRFRADGNNSIPPLQWNVPAIEAVAVNDNVGQCNLGQVYTVENLWPTGGLSLLHVFDINGNLLMDLVWNDSSGPGFVYVTGLACDLAGNVYVVDRFRARVLKFDASHFGLPHYVSKLAVPDLEFNAYTGGGPLDVAVDQNGRVHVTYDSSVVVVYNPDATIWSSFASPGPSTIFGVDATDPGANTWVADGDVRRFSYDSTATPTEDFIVGSGMLTFPWGIEYQKFSKSVFFGGGALKLRCEERMFVCDYGGPRVAVFGEDHLSTQIPANAVAWWRLGEKHNTCAGTELPVHDSIGSNNGTLVGIPTPVEGAVGCALAFAGAQAVQVPDSASLDVGTGDFSIEGWIRTEQTIGLGTILDKRVGTAAGYHVYIYDGYIGVQLNGGSTYQNWTNPNGFVADGKWHHFAFAIDRGAQAIRAHVDGALTNGTVAAALAGLSLDTSSDLYIGSRNYAGAGFIGAIDELTIYKRALSLGEIASIWGASYAGKDQPLIMYVDTYGPPH